MSVSERHVGTVTIIDTLGQLTQGAAGDALRDKVGSLLQQGHRNILVNLGAVSYMDSSGLGALVSSFATVQRQGGALKLINLTKRLNDLLVITKLSNVFECFDDETAAVDSFGTAG
jgi:anti-sigma B factor antagonist